MRARSCSCSRSACTAQRRRHVEQANGGQRDRDLHAADIAGLAKVFTGWSWDCPAWPANGCFTRRAVSGVSDPDRCFKPMRGYAAVPQHRGEGLPRHHDCRRRPGRPGGQPEGALDTLANHPNVGPFIGKQLIQRLVTSNPSPAYVRAVAAAFNNNGSGVRGDMKAVVKAILLDPEARTRPATSAGKVREPVLRLAALLRAFTLTSVSGDHRHRHDRQPPAPRWARRRCARRGVQLLPSRLRADGHRRRRPAWWCPRCRSCHETSVAGYMNYMRDNDLQASACSTRHPRR